MNNKLKILVVLTITICLATVIGIFIKKNIQKNEQKMQEEGFLYDSFVIVDGNGYVLKGYDKDADPSTEKVLEKHEFVKGFVNYLSKEEGLLEIHNSYIVGTRGLTIDEYNHFLTKVSFSPNDVSIINYYTSEEMEFEEISRSDLLLFNAKIIYSTIKEPIIAMEDNKIFVLHTEDLYNIVLEQYNGKKVLNNVKILSKDTFDFENKEYKYVYAQMKIITPKNDELVYYFTLLLNDDTIIENSPDSKYADIILEDTFENTTRTPHYINCREVNKITYK